MNETSRSAKRLFGRRKGRPLRARKSALMDELLPRVRISLPSAESRHSRESGNPELINVTRTEQVSEAETLSPRTRRGWIPAFAGMTDFHGCESGRDVNSLWLEVGFGGGEHLAAVAEQKPDALFMGCEPFVNGVASLLGHIDDKKLSNVLIYPDDARDLIDGLPDSCLDGCYVLFPDPWPKKRHIERRFINGDNLNRFSRIMKKGAELWMATDVEQLGEWMRGQCEAHKDFGCAYDSRNPPKGWVSTRYEQKGRAAGRSPVYLCYTKR